MTAELATPTTPTVPTAPEAPTVPAPPLPYDLLGRDALVQEIMELVHTITRQHGSATFSLNGSWGSGKSFVLDRVERQLRDYQDEESGTERYVVFRYDCWKYDYYEEPVVALATSMRDSLDDYKHLIPEEKKRGLLCYAKAFLPFLVHGGKSWLAHKLALEPAELEKLDQLIERAKEGKNIFDDCVDDLDKAIFSDPYYQFNKALKEVQEGLNQLTRDKPLVIIVDELDRCLPAYVIKILERLHHLFAGVNNCCVILAVDKGQLEYTVKQVFGPEMSTDHYLRKFIDFGVSLDVGKISASFREKYADYFALFDAQLVDPEFDVDAYCAALFDGIDIRTQERLMGRIRTVHRLVFSDEVTNYSVLCFELLLLVVKYHCACQNLPSPPHLFSIEGSNCKFGSPELCEKGGPLDYWNRFIESSWSFISFDGTFSNCPYIPQLLVWYSEYLYASTTNLVQTHKNLNAQFRLQHPFLLHGLPAQNSHLDSRSPSTEELDSFVQWVRAVDSKFIPKSDGVLPLDRSKEGLRCIIDVVLLRKLSELLDIIQ